MQHTKFQGEKTAIKRGWSSIFALCTLLYTKQECLPISGDDNLFLSGVWVLADFVISSTCIDAFLVAGGSSVWTFWFRMINSVVCTPACMHYIGEIKHNIIISL